jgi:hypothetical protein
MMTPPDSNPVTAKPAKIIRRQEAVPFRPFVIVTWSGMAHEVPTPDNLTITRILRRIDIESNDGSWVEINPLHVTAVEGSPSAA